MSTLPTGIVQELVMKRHMSEVVPESYVCVDERDQLATTLPPTFPIISMKHLLSDDEALSVNELGKMHSACKDWGFFQVSNETLMIARIKHYNIYY